jgi:hypothetical protein
VTGIWCSHASFSCLRNTIISSWPHQHMTHTWDSKKLIKTFEDWIPGSTKVWFCGTKTETVKGSSKTFSPRDLGWSRITTWNPRRRHTRTKPNVVVLWVAACDIFGIWLPGLQLSKQKKESFE